MSLQNRWDCETTEKIKNRIRSKIFKNTLDKAALSCYYLGKQNALCFCRFIVEREVTHEMSGLFSARGQQSRCP